MGETRPDEAADGGFDLFDRWLEHRHQAPADGSEETPAADTDAADTGGAGTDGAAAPADEEPGTPTEPRPAAAPPGPGREPALSPPAGLSNSAGWAVLSAFRAPAEPAPEPAPEPVAEPPAEPPAGPTAASPAAGSPAPSPAPAVPAPRLPEDVEPGTPAFPLHRTTAREDAAAGDPAEEPVPDLVEFTPRTGARRVVGLVLLASLAGTAAAAWAAYQDPSTTRVGIAATLAVLSLVVWALRAGSPPARLAVRRGELEVQRGGTRHRFDLTSRYTPIDVLGDPSSPGTWRVLFHRRSMAPFVVDASMVDPVAFTRVLERYRPRQD